MHRQYVYRYACTRAETDSEFTIQISYVLQGYPKNISWLYVAMHNHRFYNIDVNFKCL